MYRKLFKRLLDILIAFLLIPVLLLVLIIFAPVIYFEDRGPIFYNAQRLGKDCRLFKMYKLRSMYINANDIRNKDGSTYNSDNDSRVTKIGRLLRKTSIDELPQVLNVLKGDMSFVGPRPDLPDALNVFRDNEIKKLSVKPGITGYSQAYHRNLIELHERFREDVYYAENISFIFDFKIVMKTIGTVILRRGVYRNETN